MVKHCRIVCLLRHPNKKCELDLNASYVEHPAHPYRYIAAQSPVTIMEPPAEISKGDIGSPTGSDTVGSDDGPELTPLVFVKSDVQKNEENWQKLIQDPKVKLVVNLLGPKDEEYSWDLSKERGEIYKYETEYEEYYKKLKSYKIQNVKAKKGSKLKSWRYTKKANWIESIYTIQAGRTWMYRTRASSNCYVNKLEIIKSSFQV